MPWEILHPLVFITRQIDWIKQFVALGTPLNALRADGHSPILLPPPEQPTTGIVKLAAFRTPRCVTLHTVGFLLGLDADYSLQWRQRWAIRNESKS